MRHAINPLKPWTPDLSVIGPDNSCTVPGALARTISENPAVIGLIAVFNIINSIAMSVSARIKLYGAFRAVGLSVRQLAGMIVAEAAAYTVTGSLFGIVLGMVCNRVLYDMLVTSHWGDAWSVPVGALSVILGIVLASVALAVAGPVRRIGRMSIVDTIGAQ